ncbi:MAG: hypothetical protein HYT37_03205 [Candidatus Sungbacteria bacterium]|nr:hypothetical protein [Candidatus Sungbacteria bacterium]
MADNNKQDDLFTPFGAMSMTKEEEDDFLANFAKAGEILFGEDESSVSSEENKKTKKQNNPQ